MSSSVTTKSFADRLFDLIKDSGKNLKDLEKEIGVPAASLSCYQNDTREASIGSLYKIARYFNVSADWLLGIHDTRSQDVEIQDISKKTGLSDKAIDMLRRLSEPYTGPENLPELKRKLGVNKVNSYLDDFINAVGGVPKPPDATDLAFATIENTHQLTKDEINVIEADTRNKWDKKVIEILNNLLSCEEGLSILRNIARYSDVKDTDTFKAEADTPGVMYRYKSDAIRGMHAQATIAAMRKLSEQKIRDQIKESSSREFRELNKRR